MERVILAESPLARAGSVDFEALVYAHAGFVFKIAFAILRNVEDSEDVVQETFFRAFRSGEAGEIRRMRAWLARIAWRLAIDKVRKKPGAHNGRVSADLLPIMPSKGPGAEEALIENERLALLEKLVAALPREFREPLQLFTVEGMAAAEIAEILGLPESAVRTRLSRARKLLKEKLAALKERL